MTSPAHPPLAHYWETIDGGFWFRSAYEWLVDQLPSDRPTQWVEVGVFHGQSLAWLGVEVANRGLPVTIHAVDNFAGWPGVTQGPALERSFTRNTLPIRQALDHRFLVHPVPSVVAAQDFPPKSCDVVWIDADHSYAGCKADIAAWWPLVKPGGYLGGDDWAFRGVRQAVGEAFPEGIQLGDGERLHAPWPWWLVRKP